MGEGAKGQRPLLPPQSSRGYGYLAQRNAAVVGGHQPVGQDLEPLIIQAGFKVLQQQAILKNTPRQGNQVEPSALPKA